jgi:hypothetical protein
MKRHPDRSDDIKLRKAMLAAGYVPPKEEDLPVDLTIEVMAGMHSVAYAFACQIEYVLPLCIHNHSYGPLELGNVLLQAPWGDGAAIVWIRPSMADSNVFQLPSGRVYCSEQVLNACLRGGFGIRPGKSLEGYLLGLDYLNKIPDEWICDPTVPVRIATVDQFERKHVSEIEMSIDRSSLKRRFVQVRRKAEGLFEPLTEPAAPSIRSESEAELAKVVHVEGSGMPEG